MGYGITKTGGQVTAGCEGKWAIRFTNGDPPCGGQKRLALGEAPASQFDSSNEDHGEKVVDCVSRDVKADLLPGLAGEKGLM